MALNHDLDKAKELILAGEVVAIPTETVYGLAASIHSEEGIKKIFSVKDRPLFDPLIVHISHLDQKSRVVKEWPEIADHLAKWFWPGPLTMVLPKHPSLNPLITAGLDTVGIRLPAHPVARALIDRCEVPLAAPSANKFGKTSPTKAEHVLKGLSKDIFVLDGGQSEVGLESTVISFTISPEKTIIHILRPGAITKERLEEALQDWKGAYEIEMKASNASPGHTEHHYMPNIPLVIVEQDDGGLKQKTKDEICRDFYLEPMSRGAELRLDPSPKLAARALYVGMRECSDSGAAFIYVFRTSEQIGGLWEAIWDRLQRASSKTY